MTFEIKTWDDKSVDENLENDMIIHAMAKKMRLMNIGIDGLSNIISRFNLERFIEFYEHLNSSSNLPYHNRYHMHCMVLNCYEGLLFHDVSDSEARGLLAGTIMHDFDHSGGKKSDSENVSLAITSLHAAHKYASAIGLGLSSSELGIAVDAVKATEFPYTFTDLSLTQKIIRDADLMQPYEEDGAVLLKQYRGLKKEVCPTASIEDFANGVLDFLNGVRWHSMWGIEKAFNRDWESAKHRVHDLLLASE
jgi:hypothetical protein